MKGWYAVVHGYLSLPGWAEQQLIQAIEDRLVKLRRRGADWNHVGRYVRANRLDVFYELQPRDGWRVTFHGRSPWL